MNKYTLSFTDEFIENKFVKYSTANYQVKAFNFCSICYLIYFLSSLLLGLFNFDLAKVLTRGIGAFILITCIVIVRKRNNKVDFGLFILNIIISIFEWEQDDSYDKYNYYLYGNNSMLVHTLLLFTQSFKPAVITNFLLCGIRILITWYYTDIIYLQLSLAIFSSLGLVYILYLCQSFSRKSFLLTLKDDSWELMLPLILRKPFLMFSFDQEHLNYCLKMINKDDFPFDEENTLNNFLGQAQIGQQSLQEYIYNQIIKKSSNHSTFVQEIDIKFKAKHLTVLLSGCHLAQPNYFLVMQSEGREMVILEEQMRRRNKKFIQFFYNHVKQTCLLLKKSLVHNSPQILIQLLISYRESLIFQNHALIKPEIINLTRILKRVVSYFQEFNYSISLMVRNRLMIKTIYPYLLVFLYEICKSFDHSKHYKILVNQDNEKATLKVDGLDQLPLTKQFQYCEQFIISEKVWINNCYIFIFLETPNTPFFENNYNHLSLLE